MTEPEPPDDIPAYMTDGIAPQGEETLTAIEDCARARREYLETLAAQSVDETALADPDEQLVEVEEGQDGTVVIKKVPCGKNCGGCPSTSSAVRESVLSGRTKNQYRPRDSCDADIP